eukprot:g20055.t1
MALKTYLVASVLSLFMWTLLYAAAVMVHDLAGTITAARIISLAGAVEEYLEQARKLDGSQTFDLPIPRIYGFTHTSCGLGLVVERIADKDGKLAPTLTQLIMARRLTDNHMRLVEEFFARCRKAHIVLMDVNPSNFVISNRSGVEEIFCIDGTGEKQFFRIYASSRLLNDLKLKVARRKLLDKIARFQVIAEEKRTRQTDLAYAPSP